MPSLPFFQKFLQLAWLVSLSRGQTSWCQAEPGSCAGRRHRLKEPRRIDLNDRQAAGINIHRVARFLDWDGDSDLDFVAVYCDGVPNASDSDVSMCRLGFFERLANDSFMTHELVRDYIETLKRNYLHVAMADWDGDGAVDLLMATFVNGTLVVSWANRTTALGNGEVKSINVILADYHSPEGGMQAVDWDLDGDTDLILGGRYFERVDQDTVIELIGGQNPLGTLVEEGAIDINDMQFQIADMDGDGYLEMMIPARGLDLHVVPRYFRRAIDGTLVEQMEHPFQVFLYFLWTAQTADWNSDGLLDLLVYSENSVQYFECVQDADLALDYHTTMSDFKIPAAHSVW
eukprot:s3485_g11.t1